MAAYIDNYLSLHATLPSVTVSALSTLRRNDDAFNKIGREINAIIVKVEKGGKACSASDGKAINQKLKQMEKLCDNKLTLSTRLYDIIDKHMKTGTRTLKSLESVIEAKGMPVAIEGESVALTPSAGGGGGFGVNAVAVEGGSQLAGASGGGGSGVGRKRKHDAKSGGVGTLDGAYVPVGVVDESEPLYCTCRQVAYGDMVGCDNEDCPVEWFHYKCVGLNKAPKSKWLCPQCASERKKKLKQEAAAAAAAASA